MSAADPAGIQGALCELRSTMGKMELALSSIEEGIAWTGADLVIQWSNAVFARMAGEAGIALLGRTVDEVLALEDSGTLVPHAAHPARAVLEAQVEVTGCYRLVRGGLHVEVAVSPVQLPGAERGVIVVVRDAEERRELEQTRLQGAALQAAGDAIVITDAEGAVHWVNRAFIALTGYDADAIYGKGLDVLKSGQTASTVFQDLWQTITGGHTWSGELVNRRRDGSTYTEEQTITPVVGRDGRPTHYIAIKRDISWRKASEQALRDSESALRDLYEITVSPASVAERIRQVLALGCARFGLSLGVLAEVRGPQLVVVEACGGESALKAGDAFDLASRYCERTVATDHPVSFHCARGTEWAEHPCYRLSGIEAYLAMRVLVAGRVYGTIRFSSPNPLTRPFTEWECALVRLMAQWVGIELENQRAGKRLEAARRQEVTIAARIQKTLLLGPARLLTPSFRIAAATQPSRSVDGDFFDVLPLGDTVDLVVGDVMGKGVGAALLGAATKTGIQRSLTRMIIASEQRLLPTAREIVMSLHADIVPTLIQLESFVTLCYVRLQNRGPGFAVVNCGHNASTVLRADGRIESFLGDNMPMGFALREDYVEREYQLETHEMLVLYSDGITEAQAGTGERFGEERLHAWLREARPSGLDEVVSGVFGAVRAFCGDEAFGDDLTILVVQRLPERTVRAEASHAQTFAAAMTELAAMRKAVEAFCARALEPVPDEPFVSSVLLALTELATNIVNHAYHGQPGGSIETVTEAMDDGVRVTLIHEGDAFAGRSTRTERIDDSQESGFGIYIIEQAVDRVEYVRLEDGRNAVIFEKCRPRDGGVSDED